MTYYVGTRKITDYVTELKEFEKNGFLFTEIGGDEKGIYLEFIKRGSKNNSEISGRISINYNEYGRLVKGVKEILEDELGWLYDKK